MFSVNRVFPRFHQASSRRFCLLTVRTSSFVFLGHFGISFGFLLEESGKNCPLNEFWRISNALNPKSVEVE
jgi:hypothetical protein